MTGFFPGSAHARFDLCTRAPALEYAPCRRVRAAAAGVQRPSRCASRLVRLGAPRAAQREQWTMGLAFLQFICTHPWRAEMVDAWLSAQEGL